MTPADIRSELVYALRDDLIGPDADDPRDADHQTESLSSPPANWYLTGFLAPTGQHVAEKEDIQADEGMESAPGEPTGEGDPETRNRDGKLTALHAKCVVVDRRWAFVTSANFTEAAQERNIAVGVLLDHPRRAEALAGQFGGATEADEHVTLLATLMDFARSPSSHSEDPLTEILAWLLREDERVASSCTAWTKPSTGVRCPDCRGVHGARQGGRRVRVGM